MWRVQGSRRGDYMQFLFCFVVVVAVVVVIFFLFKVGIVRLLF